MKSRQKVLVDTNSVCFLCLKHNIRSDVDYETTKQSIGNLSRYLKVDVVNILYSLNPFKKQDQDTEVKVVVCKHCSPVLTKFDTLFRELELVRLKINASVETIYKLMTDGGSEADRVEECRQLMTDNNPGDLINGLMVEHLWVNLLQKCSHRVTTSFPEVKLERLSRMEVTRLMHRNMTEDSNELISEYGEDISNESEDTILTVRGDAVTNASEDAHLSQMDDDEDQDPLEIINEITDALLMTNKRARTDKDRFKKSKGGGKTLHPKCKVCGKVMSRSGLAIHMRTHTGEMPYKCPHCLQQFRSDCNLKKHTLSKHRSVIFADCRIDDNGQSIPDVQFEAAISMLFENTPRATSGNYVCRHCHKEYSTCHRGDLEGHLIRVHFEEMKIQLKQNLRVYREPAEVNNEISKECHKCAICGKIVKRASFNQHLLTHTKDKPLQCPHCPLRFGVDTVLRRHTLGKHRAIIFKDCRDDTITDKEFENGIAILFDNIKQTNFRREGIYPCSFCSKKPFSHMKDCEYHMIQVHFKQLSCQLREILGGGAEGEARAFKDINKKKETQGKCKSKFNKEIWKGKAKVFSCDDCDKEFETHYKHRVHLVTRHRFEVFAKYFPVGTTPDQVNSVIKQVLEHEFSRVDNDIGGLQCKISNCNLNFTKYINLQIHILINHFNEVVPKLKKYHEATSDKQSLQRGGWKTEVLEVEIEESCIKPEMEEERGNV